VLAAALAVIVVAAIWILSPLATPEVPMRVVPLTTMDGFEAGGISPDGRYVAFEWGGERNKNQDIYLKFVGSSDAGVQRLTTDAADDMAPSWSHDGQRIAYIRNTTQGRSEPTMRIRVMSPIGGGDREVSEFPVRVPANWAPGDQYLVAGRQAAPGESAPANGIFLIPLDGSQPRALTHPKPPEHHMMASFSPDGRHLAYVSCTDESEYLCQPNVLDVDRSLSPVGQPRRLTAQPTPSNIAGLCWTPDSRALVFGGGELGFTYLWRVAIDGRTPATRIDIAGPGALFPGISGDWLTFSRITADTDIYRIEGGRAPETVVSSSTYDGNVSFAPDRPRFAYCSQRAGERVDVWTADTDGTNSHQLTHGSNTSSCSPAWSPAGQRIAFDSKSPDGSWHIWTMDTDGGTLQRVTADSGDQNHPTWSRNGAWIYYTWRQAADRDFWKRDLWRVNVETGRKEQLSFTGDVVIGRESFDGTSVLLQVKLPSGQLLSQPIAGGPRRSVVACAWGAALSVIEAGIYYVQCEGDSTGAGQVHRISPDGADRIVALLEHYRFSLLPGSFAVSPDGHTILYEREVHPGGDLMMIEHFK